MIKYKKIVSLLLILTLAFSLHMPFSFAEEAPKIKLIIDLSDYDGEIKTVDIDHMGHKQKTDGYISIRKEQEAIKKIDVKPKTIVEIPLNEDEYCHGSIVLPDFLFGQSEGNCAWEISGIDTDKYLVKSRWTFEGQFVYDLLENAEERSEALTFKKNEDGDTTVQFTLTPGSMDWENPVTIKPKLSQFKVRAQTANDEQGTAKASAETNGDYTFTAKGKDGYAFDYWVKKDDESGSKITKNPYTRSVSQDTAYVAHFRKRYDTSFESDDEKYGKIEVEYINSSEGKDEYKLKPVPGNIYKFSKWQIEDGENVEESTQPELTVSIDGNEPLKKYKVFFEKVKIKLMEQTYEYDGETWSNFFIEHAYVCKEPKIRYAGDKKGFKPGKIMEGECCHFAIPFEVETNIGGDYYFTLSLGSEDGTVKIVDNLRVSSERGLTKDARHLIDVYAYPMPNISKLKADLTLRTSEDTLEPVTNTYDIEVIANTRETNSKYKYLKSVDMGPKSPGNRPVEEGFTPNSMYGRVSPVTGQAEIYMGAVRGIVTVKKDTETGNDLSFVGDFPIKKYFPNGDSRGVYAIGTAADGGLIAVVDGIRVKLTKPVVPDMLSEDGKYPKHLVGLRTLYKWDGKEWKMIPDSCFSRYRVRGDGSINYNQITDSNLDTAVAFSESDVWTNYYHWDGIKWNMNPGNMVFDCLVRKNETEAYGISDRKIYEYKCDEKVWTETGAILPKADLYTIESCNRDGNMIVRARHDFLKFDAATKKLEPLPKMKDSVESSGIDMHSVEAYYIKSMGVDFENNIYSMVYGGVYKGASGFHRGSEVWRNVSDTWKLQRMTDFDDPRDTIDGKVPRIRPRGVVSIQNPLEGVSVMYGDLSSAGANFIYTKDVTLTFDAQGGNFRAGSDRAITAPILEVISLDKVPTVSRDDKYFAGWYYDSACSDGKKWEFSGAKMPARDMTLYAKWVDKGSGTPSPGEDNPELAFHKAKALETLKRAFDKCNKGDYKQDKWEKLLKAYEDGQKAIKAAKASSGQYIENEIIKELNKAIAAIQSFPMERAGKIDVVVSMDANTLGLGYLIKPTMVTVKKGTQASQVTDDLIRQMVKEEFGQNAETATKRVGREPEKVYSSIITGKVNEGYYLAQVYYPRQKDAEVADFIVGPAGKHTLEYGDRDGNYLGEFDYRNTSGWMYSVSNGKEYPEFPGMGASGWMLSDGEVVRWQFTVYGYGGDLNANKGVWSINNIVPQLADKTSLTRLVAELRRDHKDSVLEKEEAYNDAMKALTSPKIVQAKVDAAEKKLEAVKFPEPEKESPSIRPKTTVAGDTATAEVKSEELKKAIAQAEKEKKDNIVINVETNANIKEANLHIAKSDVEVLAKKEKIRLDVKTPNGNVEIPSAVLKSISNQAKGKDISISVGDVKAFEAIDVKVEKGKVLSKEKLAVKEAVEKIYKSLPIFKVQPDMAEGLKTADIAVLEVNIKSANKYISRLGGKIGISIPTSNKYEKDKEYEVTQISEDGTAEKLKGRCDQESGKRYVKIEVSHLSTFVVNPEPVSNLTFTDIAGHWAYEAIKYAVESKLMAGISTDKFNPDGTLSRAMLATILYRVEKEPTVSQAPKYTDVEKGKWYTDAVAWASKEGIVAGYSDSVFAPNDNITREQMAAMLKRYSEYKKLDATKSKELSVFADANTVSPWATDSIKWAVAENLIHGRTKDTIVPKGTATRAEAATILKSYMENIVKSKKTETKTGAEKTDDKKSDAKKAG